MQIDPARFKEIKEKAEEEYKKIGEVYCPYFKETVSFNAKGLDHIKFKEWKKVRLISDQYVRLRLLELAPQILRESHTLQEYFGTKRLERQHLNSRWEQRMIEVKYYGFVSVIKGVRIKIIVKEVVGGKKFFWSIVPFWKPRKDPNNKKILHEGDLEIQ